MDNLPALRGVDISTLLATAVQNNVAVETVERLYALAKDMQMLYAKEAFDTAMSAFQAECPCIEKKIPLRNRSGLIVAYYAPLEDLELQTKELRSKHGFSHKFDSVLNVDNNTMTTICIVKHKNGHSESTPATTRIAPGTAMQSIMQADAGAMTFTSRYAFKRAFGLIIIGEDNHETMKADENKPEMATEGQILEMEDLLITKNIPVHAVLAGNKINDWTEATKIQMDSILQKVKDAKSRR